jgi:hypothetical protein
MTTSESAGVANQIWRWHFFHVELTVTVTRRGLAPSKSQSHQSRFSLDQSNSMTSRKYIIYCAKRWPNRAGSAMPGARTFLREPEGSLTTCRWGVLWQHVGHPTSRCLLESFTSLERERGRKLSNL